MGVKVKVNRGSKLWVGGLDGTQISLMNADEGKKVKQVVYLFQAQLDKLCYRRFPADLLLYPPWLLGIVMASKIVDNGRYD